MHKCLTVFLNNGYKMSKSNCVQFGGTLFMFYTWVRQDVLLLRNMSVPRGVQEGSQGPPPPFPTKFSFSTFNEIMIKVIKVRKLFLGH